MIVIAKLAEESWLRTVPKVLATFATVKSSAYFVNGPKRLHAAFLGPRLGSSPGS